MFSQKTLGSGDIRTAVALPRGEDLNEWLAVNTVDFFNEVSALGGAWLATYRLTVPPGTCRAPDQLVVRDCRRVLHVDVMPCHEGFRVRAGVAGRAVADRLAPPSLAFACVFLGACSFYEYRWADGVTIKTPIKCPAPEYVDYLMTWVEKQFNDEAVFPTSVGTSHATAGRCLLPLTCTYGGPVARCQMFRSLATSSQR